MQKTVVHEHWSSRFAFLMAAIGSAVGLGNIWRFPFVAGENGGGAFILIYLITTAAIALPILLTELMLGRMGGRSPINTMREIARQHGLSSLWTVIGLGGTLGAFIVVSYYSVIGGWALKYLTLATAGAFQGLDNGASGELFDALTGDPVTLTFWHTAFLGINLAIVAWGLHRGIERAVTIMMPILFLLLIGMAVFAVRTPGFDEAWEFVFKADFSKVTPNTFLLAIGQGFFSVSVALGSMMAYGAYLDKNVSVARSALIIAIADTAVAIVAGFVVFPLVFTYALEPGAGAGLVFVTLPIAFGQMDQGVLIGALFFLLLNVAAMTSSISLLEPVIVWAEEKFSQKSRPYLACWVVGTVWAVGLGTVFSFNIWEDFHPLAGLGVQEEATLFEVLDFSATSLLMPTTGLLMSIFAGWILSRKTVLEALGVHDAGWFRLWRFSLQVLVPLAILGIFASNI